MLASPAVLERRSSAEECRKRGRAFFLLHFLASSAALSSGACGEAPAPADGGAADSGLRELDIRCVAPAHGDQVVATPGDTIRFVAAVGDRAAAVRIDG